MADSTLPPAGTEPPKIRQRAEQDQQVANDITAALTLMQTARDDSEVEALLRGRGYDEDSLGRALVDVQAPAQAAYDARQVAMGVARRIAESLAVMEAQERKDYSDYREIGRAIFKGASDRTALGLNGAAPSDLQKFITTARASYAAGRQSPYTEKLTVRGYSPTAINAELAGIEGVEGLAKAQGIAIGAAKKATEDRDTTYKALKSWMSEFNRIAKRTLRDRPDLLTKLGL